MSDPDLDAVTPRRPLGLAIALIVFGIIGFGAAFQLTIDKIATAANPNAALDCNLSVLVQCGKNLGSWQGSVFGFPNPILGLAGWTAAIAMGVIILAVPSLPRWFWLTFNAGVTFAIVLVIFLIITSIYVLHTLCPWCMVTWAVTIPAFWATTLYNFEAGNFGLGARARAVFETLYSWTWVIVLASYVLVAVLAQIQLDWIHRAFV